jgi:hypothetical protein
MLFYYTFYLSLQALESQDSSVGIETGYGLDDRCSIPGSIPVFNFSLLHSIQTDLGPTQPPIQCVPRVKQPRREADNSIASSAEVKNGGAIPSFPLISSWYRDNFTFYLSRFHMANVLFLT